MVNTHTHTNHKTTANRTWLFESWICDDSEDQDACKDDPISSGWSPPPAHETTTDTHRAQGESLLPGHITQHEPLWSVQSQRLSVVLLWLSLVVTVLMFLFGTWLSSSLSSSCLCFCSFYFWLISVCVLPHLWRKSWLFCLSWGKLKEKVGRLNQEL